MSDADIQRIIDLAKQDFMKKYNLINGNYVLRDVNLKAIMEIIEMKLCYKK